jgi:hypothetical protein
MAKVWVSCHAFEVMVDFVASSIYCLCAPSDEMVIKETFMKLVVYIGGETLEYVSVG